MAQVLKLLQYPVHMLMSIFVLLRQIELEMPREYTSHFLCKQVCQMNRLLWFGKMNAHLCFTDAVTTERGGFKRRKYLLRVRSIIKPIAKKRIPSEIRYLDFNVSFLDFGSRSAT